VKFDPARTDVYLQGMKVCTGGLAADFSEAELSKALDEPECHVRLVIKGSGRGKARVWTCDFTEEYIRINATYRT
jgi:glutamate N-acetyltransferase/amino-acid N-acetyltransferase